MRCPRCCKQWSTEANVVHTCTPTDFARNLEARITELEAVADGRGLTHTIAIAPGVVVYGNAVAASTLEGIMATVERAKDSLGL